MSTSRPILAGMAALLAVGLVVAACGSGGASAPAVVSSAAATPSDAPATAVPAATTAAAVPASVAPSVAPSVAAGGVPDCSGGQIGRKAFKVAGFEAQRYCGPATGTVTVSGVTATITSGWCETNSAGFAVTIGTQLFGSPSASLEPDLFLVLVSPTTGAGTISGVIGHKGYLLTTSPVTFAADKRSGTFAGEAIVGGHVSGSFACN